MNDTPLNPPPHNEAMERAVLAEMMFSKTALGQALDKLTVESFYVANHVIVFRAICEVHKQGLAVDPLSVSRQIPAKDMDAIGGIPCFMEIANQDYVTVVGASEHVKLLSQDHIAREALVELTQLSEKIREGGDSVEVLLDRHQEFVANLASKTGKTDDVVRSEKAMEDVLATIEERKANPNPLIGIPSGFKDLDSITGGWQPGQLIIVGGRPNMGKTSLARRFAYHAASETPVCYFTLEMTANEVALATLATEAQVDSKALARGELTDRGWERVSTTAAKIAELPLMWDDKARHLHQIRSAARYHKSRDNIGLIIIDYAQLVQVQDKRVGNREQEVSTAVRALKDLAVELELVVIALSQLNRNSELRNTKRPQIADLRESGELEQASDQVYLIHRSGYYTSTGTFEEDDQPPELIIPKHRSGPTGAINLRWEGSMARYDDALEYTITPSAGIRH